MIGQFMHSSIQSDLWRHTFMPNDFYILPFDSSTPTASECFEDRFFCSKTGSIMLIFV